MQGRPSKGEEGDSQVEVACMDQGKVVGEVQGDQEVVQRVEVVDQEDGGGEVVEEHRTQDLVGVV